VAQPQQRLQVFDVASGARLVAIDGSSVGLGRALRFRPGSGELAFVTEHLQRIDANTGARVAQHDLPAGGSAPTYSADGRFLAVLLRGRAVARVFDLVAGGFRDEDFTTSWPAAISATLTALALSPDGSQVAVGNNNGPIRIRQRGGATLAVQGNGAACKQHDSASMSQAASRRRRRSPAVGRPTPGAGHGDGCGRRPRRAGRARGAGAAWLRVRGRSRLAARAPCSVCTVCVGLYRRCGR